MEARNLDGRMKMTPAAKALIDLLYRNLCTSIPRPFWREVVKMPEEKRAVLKQLTSDEIKEHNWLVRK